MKDENDLDQTKTFAICDEYFKDAFNSQIQGLLITLVIVVFN